MFKILCSDVIRGLEHIESNSVHLIITSCPYGQIREVALSHIKSWKENPEITAEAIKEL